MTRTRWAEIFPGACIWLTFIVTIILSFIRPIWMIYFIILFDLYWMLRIMYFVPFLLLSWWRYRRALKRDWQKEAEAQSGYQDIYHLIFLPTYKEEEHVVRATLSTLAQADYPCERMIVVLAGEERDLERFEQMVTRLKPEFESTFMHLWSTVHAKDMEGDVIGKGSNLHWSGKQILPNILATGIAPEDIIVSSFDVDTLVHPKYFSCLTYLYLTVQDPTHSSYQPVALYNNNLWQSPAPVRVAMFGTTFWLMTELARPEGMMTFSSHSMSLRMLMDVGFWQRDIVSEDSRIFLQGLVHYHGKYRVTPIHLPVSMDTVMTGNYGKALIALYKQLRRWAWGVENFPYMVRAFRQDVQMPFWTKLGWLFKQWEGAYTWATAPILIFVLGYLPFFVAPDSFRSVALFQNTPFTLQWLMRFSMIGLLVSASLALTLLPPRPARYPRIYAYSIILLQWILLPVTFVLFGAIPAIDAQTRLMLGKTLGFQVSPKRKL
ncbi:glycosyltransferase family 2 protein [Candidatus Uhrbacteria bacterium]|nr:glycosyltransferase family 2 protein [Candidatus Uhrbacteria bacterium]